MGTGKIQKTVSEDCKCEIEELIGSLERVALKLAGGEAAPKKVSEKPKKPKKKVKKKKSRKPLSDGEDPYVHKWSFRFSSGAGSLDNENLSNLNARIETDLFAGVGTDRLIRKQKAWEGTTMGSFSAERNRSGKR